MAYTIKIFKDEIDAIQDVELQDFLNYYFTCRTPEYFWTIPASKTGRYHPVFAQGEGGLVRHTKAAAMVLEQLLRLSSYAYMNDAYKDYARAAILLHDTCKYGVQDSIAENSKADFAHHGEIAAENVADAWIDFSGGEKCPEMLYLAIRAHMGQWTEKEFRPFTPLDRLVHQADYISSFAFWDIPALHELAEG